MKARWKKLEVKEGDKTQTVYYPDMGDRIETHDLEQFAEEKTREDLRKAPPREQRKHSEKEVGQALKEFKEKRRKYY